MGRKLLRTLVISLTISLTSISLSVGQVGLQRYTPSVVLLNGQWEFKNFHNYYIQTKQFGPNGGKILTGNGRESYYTMINQFLYGVSDHVNIGIDVWIKSVSLEINAGANWSAITGIGPKIKLPLSSLPGFSFQSTFLFPLAENLEGDAQRAFLENDRSVWINQLFFDRVIAPDFQVFLQFSFWYSIVRNSFRKHNFVQTPISGFLSYLPTDRWTVYFTTEFWPVHYSTIEQQARAFDSFFIQAGIGTKYQLIPGNLEIELLYTNFVYGSLSQGAGETVNVGLRWLN